MHMHYTCRGGGDGNGSGEGTQQDAGAENLGEITAGRSGVEYFVCERMIHFINLMGC